MGSINRRLFLRATAVSAVAVTVPTFTASACLTIDTIQGKTLLKGRDVKTALVVWYSQTGNTARMGRLMAKTLEKSGVSVIASEMRDLDAAKLPDVDLIIVGSPVFYYDTPPYVTQWIDAMPDISGIPTAAFVTFGGPEGNQDNAACTILAHCAEKGGVPVGLKTFMNMSTYPLAWSETKVHHKTWMSRDLPDEETYQAARAYADLLVQRVGQGQSDVFTRKLTLREMVTKIHPIWWTKLVVKGHGIDREKCVGCGTCVAKCPAGAIDLEQFEINTKKCELCFGCINNCPAQAVVMTYNGENVFGYHEFMKKRGLRVIDPEELQEGQ